MVAMNIITLALLCLAPAFQDSWRDTHRVYLRNGNFLDGRLEQVGDKEILFRWNPNAVLRIRTMEVVKIEEIKIRPLSQEPKKVAIRDDRPTPPTDGIPPPPPKDGTPTRPQTEIGRLLEHLMTQPDMSWDVVVKQLRELGLDGARAMIAELPSMDAERTNLVTVALDQMRDLKIESELRGLLGEKRPDLRLAACRLLANRGASTATRSISPLLSDSVPQVREAALLALGILGDASTIDMTAALSLDSDPKVRARAFRTAEDLSVRTGADNDLALRWVQLSGRAPRGALAAFANALGRVAERAGDGFPREEVEARLIEILRERDDDVRSAAAFSLGGVKSSETAAEAIVTAMETERRPKVLVSMCEGLGRLKMQKSVAPLIEQLRSDSADVRSAAQRALERTTGVADLGSDYEKWRAWLESSGKGSNP
jgi:HEAT repeat protein